MQPTVILPRPQSAATPSLSPAACLSYVQFLINTAWSCSCYLASSQFAAQLDKINYSHATAASAVSISAAADVAVAATA